MPGLLDGVMPSLPLGGYAVVESPLVPEGRIFKIGDELHVRDAWRQIRFPLVLADFKAQALADLAEIVAAAEARLGLVSS